jgi:hypothetical protein
MCKNLIVSLLYGFCILNTISCSTTPIARISANSITIIGGGSFAENSSNEYHKYTAQNAIGSVTLESGSQTKTQSSSTESITKTILGFGIINAGSEIISDGLNYLDKANN